MNPNLSACAECGMAVSPGEYHPFAACLMFKGCHDGDQVRANLAAVRGHAAQQDADKEWRPLENVLAAEAKRRQEAHEIKELSDAGLDQMDRNFTAMLGANKPTAYVAPMSDKLACGAQNVECERQPNDPAMAGDEWLKQFEGMYRAAECDVSDPTARFHLSALLDHARKRVQPASGAISLELLSFLNGSGEIDGVGFGEKHPAHKGMYWWRKLLPQPGDVSASQQEPNP